MWSGDKGPFLTLGLAESRAESKVDLPDRIAEWKLEPELNCPTPRAVIAKYRFSGKVFWGIILLLLGSLFVNWRLRGFEATGEEFLFLLVPFGFALLIYFVIAENRSTSKWLVSRGVASRGVVLNREWVSGEAGSYQACTAAYDTADGQRLTLAFEDEKLSRGDTLTVLYLPESPARAMPYKDCHYKAVFVPDECK